MRLRKLYIFFPLCPQVFLAVLVAWFICWVLTVTGVLPDDPAGWGYLARTDVRIQVLTDAPWLRVPYPGNRAAEEWYVFVDRPVISFLLLLSVSHTFNLSHFLSPLSRPFRSLTFIHSLSFWISRLTDQVSGEHPE